MRKQAALSQTEGNVSVKMKPTLLAAEQRDGTNLVLTDAA